MSLKRADNFGWQTAAQLSRLYATVDPAGGSILGGPYGRAGGSGVRFSGDAAAYLRDTIAAASGPTGAVAIIQADLRISAAPAAVTALFRIMDGATVQATLAIGMDRTLQVYRGDLTTALGSASSYVVPVNTFISVGLKLTIGNSAGAALVHVWAPGDVAAQVALTLTTQDTQASSNATWDGYDLHAACAGNTDWTNLVVADGAGGVNDALLGPADVIVRRPVGAGAVSGLTPSSGFVNFAMVDDPTADDVVTTVNGDEADEADLYVFEGVADASATIRGVVTAAVAAGSGALAQTAREDATDDDGATVSVGAAYTVAIQARDLAPSGSAWTPARFNTSQFGLKVVDVAAGVAGRWASGVATGNWDDHGVTDPMTLVVRMTWNSGQGGIIEKVNATRNGFLWNIGVGWSLAVDNNDRVTFQKCQNNDAFSGTTAREAGSSLAGYPGVLVSGQSTLVAVTYDPTADQTEAATGHSIHIFYDGIDVTELGGNTRSGSTPQQSDTSATLVVGSTALDFPGLGNPTMAGTLDGTVDCAMIFDRILTADELAALTALTLPCAAPDVKVTQQVALVVAARTPDGAPAADPDGDGTVGSSTDPDPGIDLCDAEVPVAFADITPVGGATRRYSKQPINHGVQDDCRVQAFGSVTRSLSDRSGNIRGTSASPTLLDSDRFLRGLEATDSLVNAAIRYFISTESAIKAGLTPRRVFSGLVKDSEPLAQLAMRLQASGYLQSLLDVQPAPAYPRRVFSVEDFPNLANDPNDPVNPGNPTLIGKPIPIGYGQLSDEALGIAAVGVCPAFYTGKRLIPVYESYWDEYVFFGHAPGAFQSLFVPTGPTLSTGTSYASRTKILPSDPAVEYLMPGNANWTTVFGSAAPYRDFNGHRYTVCYGAGPRSELNRTGQVPLVANLWGIEDVGDGSGDVITSLARQMAHLLINWALNDYQAGAWLAPPTIDGYSRLSTAGFEAAKDVSEARITGGYQGAFILGAASETYDLSTLCRIFADHHMAIGENKDGQIIGSAIDPTGARVRSVSDVTDTIAQTFQGKRQRQDIRGRVLYRYAKRYVPLLQEPTPAESTPLPKTLQIAQPDWNVDQQEQSDATSIAKYGVRTKDLSLALVRDPATADDIAAQHLEVLAAGPMQPIHREGLCGTGIELGQNYGLTHFEGVDTTGYVDRLLRAEQHTTNLDRFEVEIQGLDLSTLPGAS